ncbi:unnamed protein product, partial [Tetraodon nigroviridis]
GVTLLFGFAPFWLVRGAGWCWAGPDVRLRVSGWTGAFAGGVFLATCLLALLPHSLRSTSAAFGAAGITLQFPLPEFVVAAGFFLVLVLEQVALALSRPSPPSEQRQPLLAGSSFQNASPPPRCRGRLQADSGPTPALRAFLLLFSLSLHSALEGLAVGLLEDGREVLEVCLALSVHKSLVAASLAFQLRQGRLRRSAVASCLLMFAAMSPLGIGVGMGLTETKMSARHQLARSALEGLATGTFVYVTFMEVVPQQLQSTASRIPKVAAMLLGFAAVTAALFVKLA